MKRVHQPPCFTFSKVNGNSDYLRSSFMPQLQLKRNISIVACRLEQCAMLDTTSSVLYLPVSRYLSLSVFLSIPQTSFEKQSHSSTFSVFIHTFFDVGSVHLNGPVFRCFHVLCLFILVFFSSSKRSSVHAISNDTIAATRRNPTTERCRGGGVNFARFVILGTRL